LGGPGLREALANRWAGGDCGQVMATQGSSEAIFLVMNALLEPGDEVVVLEPAYQQLYAIAESIGCRLKRWRLRFEQGFAPDLEELAGLLTPKTRMVIVNFPHNPTGSSVTVDEQARLIELVARTGAYLVWDAAFAELVYDKPRLPDPNLLYERAIVLGTLSKAFGLAGLRVGWCFAAPDVLERCVQIRDYTTLHLSPLVELIAQQVIENADTVLAIRLSQAKRNLEIVSTWLKQHADLLAWSPPQGGVTFFPRLINTPDVEAFCRRLAEQRRILLVPGICFKHPQHVRIGFGGPTSLLEKGLLFVGEELYGENNK
jgi:capreomycidine synthase